MLRRVGMSYGVRTTATDPVREILRASQEVCEFRKGRKPTQAAARGMRIGRHEKHTKQRIVSGECPI